MGPRLYPDEADPPPPSTGGFSIEPEDRPFYGEEPPRRGFSAILRGIIYSLVAIGCAGALWYAYNKGRDVGAANNGTVPLIRADQSAAKVKPDQPGGESVPGQDMQVYNPSQPGAKVERLLPPPEQPLARPVAPPPATADANTPLPVQEIGPTPAVKPPPPAPPGAALPPTTSSGFLTATGPTPLPPPPASSTAAPTPAPAPTQTASRPVPLAPAPGGSSAAGYRVQIAATRDEPTARGEWERLKKAHEDLLGALSPFVIKADLGDKGIFYRLQAGPVGDHEKADKLCGELKKFAIACIVVKP